MRASWQYVCAIGCRDDGDKTFERNTSHRRSCGRGGVARGTRVPSGMIGLPAGTRIWIAAGVTFEAEKRHGTPFFKELVEAYITRQVRPNANNPERAEYKLRSLIKKHLSDLLPRRVDRIAVEDVLTVKNACGAHHVAANRCIEFLHRDLPRFRRGFRILLRAIVAVSDGNGNRGEQD